MNVFHFGTGARRLFGIYTPGSGDRRPAAAALLCAPWGQEYLRAHRSLRLLGTQLGATGFHVLRFDYYGTGDSAGEMTDGTLVGWEQDVEQAVDELRDTSGVDRVSIVGLRLGASLAARVASRRSRDVRNLVLWDPIVSGLNYVKELRTPVRGVISVATRAPQDGVEVNGFPLTESLKAELETLDLVPIADRLPERTLVLLTVPESAAQSPHLAFRDALSRHNGRSFEMSEAPPAWVEYRNSGAALTPVAILQRIVRWLS